MRTAPRKRPAWLLARVLLTATLLAVVGCDSEEPQPDSVLIPGALPPGHYAHDTPIEARLENALRTLASKPDEAAPVLIEAAIHDDPEIRRAGTLGLMRLGSTVTPALIRKLKEGSDEERVKLARILFVMGPLVAGTIPALREILRDAPNETRVGLLLGLRGMRAAAMPLLDDVLELLKAGDPVLRLAVLHVVTSIGPAARDAVPPVLYCLEGEYPQGSALERAAAAGALAAIGTIAEDALPFLEERAESDPDPEVRRAAATAVIALRPPRRPDIDRLIQALDSEDLAVRLRAAEALWARSNEAVAAVPALVRALETGGEEAAGLRWLAAQALGSMGPPAAAATSALEVATKDAAERVRVAAKSALEGVKGD